MPPPKTADAHDDPDAIWSRAKHAALRLLSYRARSEVELRRRLDSRFPSQVIDRLIVELKELRYLDDADFARLWRSSRERKRPRSKELMRQELLRLGVDPELIREALAGFDAAEMAYRAGRSRAQRLAGIGFEEFSKKLWPYLHRRGFDQMVIQDAVNRLWQELSDPLHGGVDSKCEEEQPKNAGGIVASQPTDAEGADY